jgi:prephenate dehydratase
MKILATLGPSGTFSQSAANIARSLMVNGADYELKYYRSLRLTCDAIPNECRLGVVPLENSLAGYVPEVLDTLAEGSLSILGQISLKVAFSLVSHVSSLEQVGCVYAQNMASMQCSRFIGQLGVPVIYVESNSTALEVVSGGNTLDSGRGAASAIVSTSAIEGMNFALQIDDILDTTESITRFVLIGESNSAQRFSRSGCSVKSSAIISPRVNTAGVLEQILRPFSKRVINLSSIISRTGATGQGLFFFIEVDGDLSLSDALSELLTMANIYHFPLYECF